MKATEGITGAVLFDYPVFQRSCLLPGGTFGMQGVDSLQRHGAVGKAEGFGRLWLLTSSSMPPEYA